MHKVWCAILVVLAAASPLLVDAQEIREPSVENTQPSDELAGADEEFEDIGLLELDVPMVVTASRREQKITTVPHAISVITAEDIRRSGARSIPDALRLVPGVDVADLSFGQYAVSPRGFHGFLSSQVLVLVDGRQIFDSVFGGTLWGSWPFQLEDIERIEVVRGPGGVTWGANAMNGIINIITKDPEDQLGLTLSVGGGSRGTHKEYLGYAFKDGKLRMRVSGEYEASDGFRRGGSILRNLEDDYKTGRMGLHAIYEAGPNDTVTISAGSSLLDGGLPPPPLEAFGQRRNSGTQANFLLGKWRHKIEEDNYFELTGYVNDFHLSNGMPAIDYRYQQLALQFGHAFKPSEAHLVTWGIDSRVDLIDATNADPFMLSEDFIASTIIGIYVQDEWRFAPKWIFNLGGRVDYESYGGFQPSVRASLAYEVNDNSMVYGAVSRAFQMPAAGSRFLDTPMIGGLAWITSKQDVRAQTLIAYELGYRGRFLDRLDANLNLFWHEYNDLVTLGYKLGPPGLLRQEYDNGGGALLYGAELDLKYAATEDLTLLANYTFEQLTPDGFTSFDEGEAITPPEHKCMVGARYNATDDLHLSSHLYYVDFTKAPNPSFPFISSRIAPYFRLDLRAEYELWNDQASIAVGVRNLLDGGHSEGGTMFLNNAEVPRMVFAEFRLTLR